MRGGAMQQMNNTGIDDIVRTGVNLQCFGRCLLCLRPVERLGKNIRVVENVGLYHSILTKSRTSNSSEVFQAQMRYLEREDAVVICYICQPASKKAERQYEQGGTVDYPSLFVEEALQHCGSVGKDGMNRQCLLKALVCLGTTAADDTSTLYHELRAKEKALLEYSIFFLHHTLRSTGYNMREFSRCSSMCVFGVVVLCRWEITGFPHTMRRRDDNKVYRRVYGTALFRLFSDLHGAQNTQALRREECGEHLDRICASCSNVCIPATICEKRKAYDLATADRRLMHEMLSTHREHCESMEGPAYWCPKICKFSYVSYEHYETFAHRFPAPFRESEQERYYVFALRNTRLCK